MKFTINDQNLKKYAAACKQACEIAASSSNAILSRVRIEAADDLITVKAMADTKAISLNIPAMVTETGAVMIDPENLETLNSSVGGLRTLIAETVRGRALQYELKTAKFQMPLSVDQSDFSGLIGNTMFNPSSSYSTLVQNSEHLQVMLAMANNCVGKNGAINLGYTSKEIKVLVKHANASCRVLYSLSTSNIAGVFSGLFLIDAHVLKSASDFAAGNVLIMMVDQASKQMRLAHSDGHLTFKVSSAVPQALEAMERLLKEPVVSSMTIAPETLSQGVSNQRHSGSSDISLRCVKDGDELLDELELRTSSTKVSPSSLNATVSNEFQPIELYFASLQAAVDATSLRVPTSEPHLFIDLRGTEDDLRTLTFWTETNSTLPDALTACALISEK